MNKRSLTPLLVLLIMPLILTVASGNAWAGGNKKLMTVKKAKVMAQRGIVESVIGLKIRSTSLWTDENSDEYKIESKVAAAIKGIVFEPAKYDKTKDIAMVTARIKLGSIKNIIGKPIHYDDIVISRVGFATSSKQYAPQLAALRAAELNAYDEMAQLIVGQKIKSNTKVKNFVLESDEVRTKTLAAIWGAEVKDFGWEEDGTAFITLRLNAKWVRDVIGNTIAYTNDNYLEVTGYGATHDELEETETESFGSRPKAVEDVIFNIPGSGGGNSDDAGGASRLVE
ncbi:MAG: hypothetical protein ACU84J_08425 [Gammaproteobacteria bacterium]